MPMATTKHKSHLVGLDHELAVLKTAIANNQPALLIGETGTGKTSSIRELAKEQGAVFRRLNLNGNTGVEEFVGKITLRAEGGGTKTVWQDGILIDAMRKGHWLLVDEINAALPEVLFVLQSLLDDDRYVVLADNDGEVVRPHKDFRFFGAMNPPADYAGTKKLNRALLSRFGVVLKFPEPDATLFRHILSAHNVGISEEHSELVSRMAEHINNSKREGAIDFYCSSRDLISLATLLGQGSELDTAFILSVLNKVDDTEVQAVLALASLYIPLKGKDGKILPTAAEREQELIETVQKLASKSLQNDVLESLITIAKHAIVNVYTDITEKIDKSKATSKKDILKLLRDELSEVDVDNMVKKSSTEKGRIQQIKGRISEAYREAKKKK